MAKFLVLCLILTDAFLLLSVADDDSVAANSPASSPSNVNGVSEGPSSRKIGKIWVESTRRHNDGGGFEAQKQESAGEDEKQQRRHRGFNKSIYGGGVILGGLATTFLVAVFCYIRATGRKNASDDSPVSSPSASPRVTDSV
ncbi:uncharacterized protein LOC115999310 [Ipomoea triloba]|uniref:uncharacterized protein LOC115999310 n=1 Tax=Ipomoea triloba TaxID=35885 RepID=UPI00125D79E3|nr:uncharacterized protein LOC115999310 [Ipomoea triloba]